MYTISKSFEISCSHKLCSGKLDDKENNDVFGKCVQFHGHNYLIDVAVSADRLLNGMVINFNVVKKVFMEKIDDVFDHSNLNEKMDVLPTAENMSKLFYDILKNEINDERVWIKSVKIWETPTSYAIYEE